MKTPMLFGCVLLAAASVAQVPTPTTRAPIDPVPLFDGAWPFDRVVHDTPGDGRLWSLGATWKASFGRDGFAYVPRLPGAPRSLSLRFTVASLRAGGVALPLDGDAMPVRTRDRVEFARGALREVYDVALTQVEQSFVIDTALPGDVELVLAVAGELVEDASRPGLQFACEHGAVAYGEAFVVRGTERLPIATTFANGTLRMHVPAGLRDRGPLVIDPILSTHAHTTVGSFSSPDVAYYQGTGRYLAVWTSEFSELDHDVLSIAFDTNGQPIASTAAAIDATTAFWSRPRVATRTVGSHFLVVAEVLDATANNRLMIWSRRRDAVGAMTVQPAVRLSDPSLPGENFGADVAGSSGSAGGNHDWQAVWTNQVNGTTAGIHSRVIGATGTTVGGIQYFRVPSPGEYNRRPQISRCNGNDIVSSPQFLVVWERVAGANNVDVIGRRVATGYSISGELLLAAAPSAERDPQVSSICDLGASGVGWLVTWQRANATRGCVVIAAPGGSTYALDRDLSNLFGVGAHSARADSDGARFLLTASSVDPYSTTANAMLATTLAWNGIDLVQQEGPTTIPGVVPFTEITALRSGGGAPGRYGLVHLQPSGFGFRPVLTRYDGTTAGTTTQVVPTACDGLTIAFDGSTALGGRMTFAVGGGILGVAGFAFGSPAPTPIPLCATCSLGVRLDQPVATLLGNSEIALQIPTAAALVGQAFAVQGLELGVGSCIAGLSFSDTVVFTVR